MTPNGPWYKVLKDRKSFHGGSFVWSLPKDGHPGEWHEVSGELHICSNGLHVTNEPAKWFAVGASVYAVECEEFGGQKDDKAVFRRVRLTRELTCDELRDLRIAGDGEWFITSGIAFAFGSCKVVARGNSQVVASDNSTINILDIRCTVTEDGNAVVIDRTQSPPVVRCGWLTGTTSAATKGGDVTDGDSLA